MRIPLSAANIQQIPSHQTALAAILQMWCVGMSFMTSPVIALAICVVGLWSGQRYWKGDGDMRLRRDGSDDDADRQSVLAYLQANPGRYCQEAEIKNATGVAKNRVRRLMRGVPGIDHAKLDAGAVCWNPPENQS